MHIHVEIVAGLNRKRRIQVEGYGVLRIELTIILTRVHLAVIVILQENSIVTAPHIINAVLKSVVKTK